MQFLGFSNVLCFHFCLLVWNETRLDNAMNRIVMGFTTEYAEWNCCQGGMPKKKKKGVPLSMYVDLIYYQSFCDI